MRNMWSFKSKPEAKLSLGRNIKWKRSHGLLVRWPTHSLIHYLSRSFARSLDRFVGPPSKQASNQPTIRATVQVASQRAWNAHKRGVPRRDFAGLDDGTKMRATTSASVSSSRVEPRRMSVMKTKLGKDHPLLGNRGSIECLKAERRARTRERFDLKISDGSDRSQEAST